MTKRWGPQTIGSYVIERPIGRGSMGTVYLAHLDAVEDYKVAVKIINPNGLPADQADEVVRRWQAEYSAMHKVRHRNVVGIVQPGIENGQHYIAMDYVEGQDLASLLKNEDLSVRRALGIAQGVAYGTGELHNNDIVHRDLKPQNIMIKPDDEPVILDLGISLDTAITGRITSPGTVVGTPGYVAPEIMFTGEKPTPAADVYGLGVIAFTALGGRHPQIQPLGPITREKLERLLELDLNQVVRRHGSNHQYLKSVLEPLLEKDPRKRPTAIEAAELLGWVFEEQIEKKQESTNFHLLTELFGVYMKKCQR